MPRRNLSCGAHKKNLKKHLSYQWYHRYVFMIHYYKESLAMNKLGTINIYVLVSGSGQAHIIPIISIVSHVYRDSKGSIPALHVQGV